MPLCLSESAPLDDKGKTVSFTTWNIKVQVSCTTSYQCKRGSSSKNITSSGREGIEAPC